MFHYFANISVLPASGRVPLGMWSSHQCSYRSSLWAGGAGPHRRLALFRAVFRFPTFYQVVSPSRPRTRTLLAQDGLIQTYIHTYKHTNIHTYISLCQNQPIFKIIFPPHLSPPHNNSPSREIIGFGSDGKIVNAKSSFDLKSKEEICQTSSKIITFIDLVRNILREGLFILNGLVILIRCDDSFW